MSRHAWWAILVAVLLAGSGAGGVPNIIVLVVDDLGWSDLGYHGSDVPTPHLDRMAAEGIDLQHFYVNRVCSPTRTALMSGRYAYSIQQSAGVITNGHPVDLPLNQTLIPRVLKRGGTRVTHAIGKWDCGMTYNASTPTHRGFDSFLGYYNADEDYYTHSCGPCGKLLDFHLDSAATGFHLERDTTTYSTYAYRDRALGLLANHSAARDGPMFLYLATQAVHGPLEAPADVIFPVCNQSIAPGQMNATIENRRVFCGMLRALDSAVGNITDLLRAKGASEDWVIWLTADNGGQAHVGGSNVPLRGNKATLWQGGTRATSMLWWTGPNKILPEALRGTQNNKLFHVTDMLPTLAGLVGASTAGIQPLDGFDVWPAIANAGTPSPRKQALIELVPGATPNATLGSGAKPKAMLQSALIWEDADGSLLKGIWGQPNCTLQPQTPEPSDKCPSGWVSMLGHEESPPPNPTFQWIFNLTADEQERTNLAASHPQLFAEFHARIRPFRLEHVVQQSGAVDPQACVAAKQAGGYVPWRPDPPLKKTQG